MAQERQGIMQVSGVCFVAAEPRVEQVNANQWVMNVWAKWSSLGNEGGSGITIKQFNSSSNFGVAAYLKTGKPIAVTGHLRIKRWKHATTGPEGETLWGCDPQLIVERNGIQLLDQARPPGPAAGQQRGAQGGQDRQPSSYAPAAAPGPPAPVAAPQGGPRRAPADLPPLDGLV